MKDILFKMLYFPLPIFWSLILILIIVKREKLYFYLKIICLAFYILLTPLFSQIIEFPLRTDANRYNENDNILLVLVPTAGIFKDAQLKWHPSSKSILRASQGEFFAKKLNKSLLISGGVLNDEGVSEASTLRNIITYKNTLYDNYSQNSYETVLNLKNTFTISNSEQKILIVTSPKHILRMSLLLNSHGFQVSTFYKKVENNINIYSFIPDIRSINSINASLYEYMAIIKYLYMKYIIISAQHE